MKLYLLSLTLALTGLCAAHQDPPKHVRVSIQWIEVPHPVLTELTGGEKKSGSALHDAVRAYVKEGKAKIVETSIVVCRSGQRAKVESIREEIYPAEYNPPGSDHEPYPPVESDIRGFTSFATRNTGVTMEVEPTIGDDEAFIDLRFVPQIVSPDRLINWMEHKDQWGDASVRMPVFESWRVNTSLTVAAGKFELASVISTKPTQLAPAEMKKILLFVRADIISAGR
jgi:hypothetical protein